MGEIEGKVKHKAEEKERKEKEREEKLKLTEDAEEKTVYYRRKRSSEEKVRVQESSKPRRNNLIKTRHREGSSQRVLPRNGQQPRSSPDMSRPRSRQARGQAPIYVRPTGGGREGTAEGRRKRRRGGN